MASTLIMAYLGQGLAAARPNIRHHFWGGLVQFGCRS
jgi:hypothetical protein